MALIEIDTNPSRGTLRLFGLAWLVFFGALGGVIWHKTHLPAAAIGVWCAAAIIPAVGWAAPKFMRAVYVGACYATYPIGLVVSFVVMAAAYYLVITPVGVAMRLLGRDSMHRRFEPDAKTYWTPHKQPDSVERYFDQF